MERYYMYGIFYGKMNVCVSVTYLLAVVLTVRPYLLLTHPTEGQPKLCEIFSNFYIIFSHSLFSSLSFTFKSNT